MLHQFKRSPYCLFVQATRPTCRFVLVRERADSPELILADSLLTDDSDSLAAQIQPQLPKGLSISRVVLLLPRDTVEMNSLRLPPATEEEIPELVLNLLTQQLEDGPGCVHDFIVSREASDGTRDILTFTMPDEQITTWKTQFRAQGFNLEAITFGGIGAVSLLNQVTQRPPQTAVVVTTTDQDTDLAVVESEKPVLFRTIPSTGESEQFVVDQLAGDIQRTLTLMGHPDDEESRVYLIGTNDSEQTNAAQALHERLALPVNLVNPFDQLNGDIQRASKAKKPSRFGNLIGTACAWNRQTMPVNFLAPKQKPVPPSLWKRFGFWGSIAAALIALAGYLIWEQRADFQVQLDAQQTELQRRIKPVKRAQAKQVTVNALDAWRANEINWLDELLFLSENLPSADKATVGAITMTTTTGRGRIDLPISVSQSTVRPELEAALRDERHQISSQRVVDVSNDANSAWRFKSVISVLPSPTPAQREKAQ